MSHTTIAIAQSDQHHDYCELRMGDTVIGNIRLAGKLRPSAIATISPTSWKFAKASVLKTDITVYQSESTAALTVFRTKRFSSQGTVVLGDGTYTLRLQKIDRSHSRYTWFNAQESELMHYEPTSSLKNIWQIVAPDDFMANPTWQLLALLGFFKLTLDLAGSYATIARVKAT